MPVLALCDGLNADGPRLARILGDLPVGAPVVVMIHGYGYDPADRLRDPHRHILALVPDGRHWGAVSWPRRLGLGANRGLAVAWGWRASGSIWQAHRKAASSAEALSRLVAACRALDPARPVHMIAHSLGARVALLALMRLQPHDVQRIILIAPAISTREARRACGSSAGRTTEIVNVVGRENWLFDGLLRVAMAWEGRRLGRGQVRDANWMDLPLDRADTLSALKGLGWRIAPARASICHWSGYLRPGIWRLYEALLLHPQQTPLPLLRGFVA